MINKVYVLILFIAFFLLSACEKKVEPAQSLKVDLMLFGSHPLLEKVKDGVITGVNSHKSNLNVTFKLHDANFQFQEAVQQSRQASMHRPDAIIAFGTPSIQAAISNIDQDIPVFFAATSNPVAIGVSKSNDPKDWALEGFTSKLNVHGLVTNFDYDSMALLIKSLVPQDGQKCVKIGYPMNDGEANSVLAFNKLKSILKSLNYCLISASVSSPLDVPAAIRILISKDVRALHIGPDNTVSGAIGSVVSIAHAENLLIFTSESASVSKGADAAFAVDFSELGFFVGNKLANHLSKIEGEEGDNNIAVFSKSKLFINGKLIAKFDEPILKKLSRNLSIEPSEVIVIEADK